jgi:hypothetical protein
LDDFMGVLSSFSRPFDGLFAPRFNTFRRWSRRDQYEDATMPGKREQCQCRPPICKFVAGFDQEPGAILNSAENAVKRPKAM